MQMWPSSLIQTEQKHLKKFHLKVIFTVKKNSETSENDDFEQFSVLDFFRLTTDRT